MVAYQSAITFTNQPAECVELYAWRKTLVALDTRQFQLASHRLWRRVHREEQQDERPHVHHTPVTLLAVAARMGTCNTQPRTPGMLCTS